MILEKSQFNVCTFIVGMFATSRSFTDGFVLWLVVAYCGRVKESFAKHRCEILFLFQFFSNFTDHYI